jgi:type I restriction enzyme S subunit
MNDVLVSNIRPYFKKIWYATFNGGCSNDVLVFRTKDGVNSQFLHYVLADDAFFDYSMATSKGTKMPRGDKKAIMEYKVPNLSFENQSKIASILKTLDDKIELNNEINNNLEQATSRAKPRRHRTLGACSQTGICRCGFIGRQPDSEQLCCERSAAA